MRKLLLNGFVLLYCFTTSVYSVHKESNEIVKAYNKLSSDEKLLGFYDCDEACRKEIFADGTTYGATHKKHRKICLNICTGKPL